MAQVSISKNGVEVGSKADRQLIEWGAIRQWDLAPLVDFEPRTRREIVKASVLSIGFDLEGELAWFHVDNAEVGERMFTQLLNALRDHVAKKGPKNFDGIPPHVRAAQEQATKPKQPERSAGREKRARVSAWPKFDEVADGQEELMRQFVSLADEPPRRRTELSDATYAKITKLCERGQALEDQGKLADAWAVYGEAFALIPEPKINWEATPWVLTVAADVAFQSKQYARALGMLKNAVNCTAPDVNPFVNLRIGQCLYGLGERKRAAHYLTLAYMAEGRDIFREEDPKYFRLLEKVLEPPKGRKRL